MKNKIILFTLFIPVIIACQNKNIVVIPSINPSISSMSTMSSSATPTIIATTTIITPNPVPSYTIDPDKTLIIASNMSEYIVETPRPTYPPEKIQEYLEQYPYTRSLKNSEIENIGIVTGFVKDEKGNPVSGANVTLRNLQYIHFLSFGYDYIRTTKTANNGYYKLNFPLMEPISVIVSLDNYITRYNETNPSDRSIGGNRDGVLDFILTKSPEIQFIKINNNVVTPYSLNIGREKLSTIYKNGISSEYEPYKNIPEHKIERFKMQSTNLIKIDLMFNNSIDKASLEENIFIKNINENNTNIENLLFKWFDDNKGVTIKASVKNSEKDIKYRLGFENSFNDSQKNTVFKNRYFALNRNFLLYSTEVSESIVFEIAGSKGELNENK